MIAVPINDFFSLSFYYVSIMKQKFILDTDLINKDCTVEIL